MIKVWRAEPRREICQSNWTERLETCCMVHPTDASNSTNGWVLVKCDAVLSSSPEIGSRWREEREEEGR